MMFAHAKDIETDLIGKLDLLDQMLHPLFDVSRLTTLIVVICFSEGINSDFHENLSFQYAMS